METIKYDVEFAENGVIIRPEDFACSVYEYDKDSEDYSTQACKAVGEEILCYLHDTMVDGGSYKFKVTINVESLEE